MEGFDLAAVCESAPHAANRRQLVRTYGTRCRPILHRDHAKADAKPWSPPSRTSRRCPAARYLGQGRSGTQSGPIYRSSCEPGVRNEARARRCASRSARIIEATSRSTSSSRAACVNKLIELRHALQTHVSHETELTDQFGFEPQSGWAWSWPTGAFNRESRARIHMITPTGSPMSEVSATARMATVPSSRSCLTRRPAVAQRSQSAIPKSKEQHPSLRSASRSRMSLLLTAPIEFGEDQGTTGADRQARGAADDHRPRGDHRRDRPRHRTGGLRRGRWGTGR